MSSKVWLSAIILSLLILSNCSPSIETTTVTRVIDGDTIVIDTGQRVRYIGIDTPEIRPHLEAYSIEAWQANSRLVAGKEVRLEKDVSEVDKYGRRLYYVYVDDIFVNAELVRLGLAKAKAYPPDTRHQEHLEQMEIEARESGRGMWAK